MGLGQCLAFPWLAGCVTDVQHLSSRAVTINQRRAWGVYMWQPALAQGISMSMQRPCRQLGAQQLLHGRPLWLLWPLVVLLPVRQAVQVLQARQ